MGVVCYGLRKTGRQRVIIGGTDCMAGIVSRLGKVTEIGEADARRIKAIQSGARTASTPALVVVSDPAEFGPDRMRVFRVMGWDRGRVVTQDLDWDHLPLLGYGVPGRDGSLVLHERVGDRLVELSTRRAQELGILDLREKLVRTALPVIAECRGVRRLGIGHYQAECCFQDGRTGIVMGSSEDGTLPDSAWFVGLDTRQASLFGDTLASTPSPPGP